MRAIVISYFLCVLVSLPTPALAEEDGIDWNVVIRVAGNVVQSVVRSVQQRRDAARRPKPQPQKTVTDYENDRNKEVQELMAVHAEMARQQSSNALDGLSNEEIEAGIIHALTQNNRYRHATENEQADVVIGDVRLKHTGQKVERKLDSDPDSRRAYNTKLSSHSPAPTVSY